jgi:hypothetical protein
MAVSVLVGRPDPSSVVLLKGEPFLGANQEIRQPESPRTENAIPDRLDQM